MTRPEITDSLSNSLEKYLDPHNDPRIYWAKEVTFDYASATPIRVDYMKFKPVKKTLEVRKTKPKLETPFRCYIYCTKGDPSDAGDDFWLHDLETFRSIQGNGTVIGEFVCDDCSLLTKAHYALQNAARVLCCMV